MLHSDTPTGGVEGEEELLDARGSGSKWRGKESVYEKSVCVSPLLAALSVQQMRGFAPRRGGDTARVCLSLPLPLPLILPVSASALVCAGMGGARKNAINHHHLSVQLPIPLSPRLSIHTHTRKYTHACMSMIGMCGLQERMLKTLTPHVLDVSVKTWVQGVKTWVHGVKVLVALGR